MLESGLNWSVVNLGPGGFVGQGRFGSLVQGVSVCRVQNILGSCCWFLKPVGTHFSSTGLLSWLEVSVRIWDGVEGFICCDVSRIHFHSSSVKASVGRWRPTFIVNHRAFIYL